MLIAEKAENRFFECSNSMYRNVLIISAALISIISLKPLAYSAGCSKKPECKKRFTYSENGAHFQVGCIKIIAANYTDPHQKIIPSETNYNSCYCAVHTSKKGSVPINIPKYATRIGDHYYIFPMSPKDKISTADNNCNSEQYSGAEYLYSDSP